MDLLGLLLLLGSDLLGNVCLMLEVNNFPRVPQSRDLDGLSNRSTLGSAWVGRAKHAHPVILE